MKSTKRKAQPTMHPHEYSQAVANLDRYRTPAQRHGNADHACTGLASELGELIEAWQEDDDEQIRSECGDVLWYATNTYHALVQWPQNPMHHWPERDPEAEDQPGHERLLEVALAVTRIIRHQQYHTYRSRGLSPLDLQQDLQRLAEAVQSMARTPLRDLAARNIEKLRQRNARKGTQEDPA